MCAYIERGDRSPIIATELACPLSSPEREPRRLEGNEILRLVSVSAADPAGQQVWVRQTRWTKARRREAENWKKDPPRGEGSAEKKERLLASSTQYTHRETRNHGAHQHRCVSLQPRQCIYLPSSSLSLSVSLSLDLHLRPRRSP